MEFKDQHSTYKLYNGVEIPCIGFGMWQTPSDQVGVDSVKSAIKAGSLEKPVTTAVVLNVKDSSGKNVSNISSADLSIDLTAAEGATLKKGQKLGLKLNKFSVIKAF